MQLEDLKNDKAHLVDFWITDSACKLKDGNIAYTQYYAYGDGGLLLREALSPSHDESPDGLARRAELIKNQIEH